MTYVSRALLIAALLISAARSVPRTEAAPGSPALQTLAVVAGQPDDITVDVHGRLVWGNLAQGTVQTLAGHRIVTVVRGLSLPEGVVSLRNGSLAVAEQGRDRIVRVNRGVSKPLYALQPVPGQEGVDGLGRDPRSGWLLVPDSPRGQVLRLSPDGRHVRVIARGLGRPVDAAVDPRGDVLVPDEHLGTLAVIAPRGHISYLGSFATPDDVVVDRAGTIWVTTLGDGGLWAIHHAGRPVRVLGGLGNPQGLTLDRCGDPIVVDQNTGRIERLLLTARSDRCAL